MVVGRSVRSVAFSSPGSIPDGPVAFKLIVQQIAELCELGGGNTAHDYVRVVEATNLVVVNILLAHRGGQTIDCLVGFLRHRFLDLHLQRKVRAALQIETQLDLVLEIVFDLGEGGREGGNTQNEIQTKNHDCENENYFPLQVRIHG